MHLTIWGIYLLKQERWNIPDSPFIERIICNVQLLHLCSCTIYVGSGRETAARKCFPPTFHALDATSWRRKLTQFLVTKTNQDISNGLKRRPSTFINRGPSRKSARG